MAPSQEAKQLAARLRALRRGQRLTQAELAAVLGGAKGISVSAISSWENTSKPTLPTSDRLRSYAIFCSQEHSAGTTPPLAREQDLTPTEREKFRALHSELLGLREAARETPGSSAAGTSIWTFETGPVTVICPEAPAAYRSPLADEANPNYTRMYRYADVDALIELWGHLRAQNPSVDFAHKLPEEAEPDDMTGHLIVLGGIVWNDVAHQLQPLLRDLPIQQVEVPDLLNGEIFRLPDEKEFRPRWTDYERIRGEVPTKAQITAEQADDAWRDGRRRTLVEDVALLARVPNPLNHARTLTVCSGVYSRGVLGAVRALTDVAVRARNESYLARRFPGGSFAMLMRVPVVNGAAMSPDLEISHNRLNEWSPTEEDAA